MITIPSLPVWSSVSDEASWVLAQGTLFGTVQVRLVLRDGYGEESVPGLTYAATRMWERGTATRDRSAIIDALDDLGASVHVTLHREHVTVILNGLIETLDAALDVLFEMILETSNPDEELHHLIVETEEENDEALCEPGATSRRTLGPLLWTGDIRANAGDGSAASRATLTRDQVHARQRSLLHAPLYVGVAADDPAAVAERVRTHVRQLRSRYPRRPEAPRTSPTPPWGEAWHIVFSEQPQGVLYAVAAGPNPADVDWASYLMHVATFGAGFQSPMIDAIRSREGLAYAPSISLARHEGGSVLVFAAQPAVDNLSRTFDVLTATWRQFVGERLSADHLASTQRQLAGSLLLDLETPRQRLSAAMDLATSGRRVEELWELPQAMMAVTADACDQIASTYGWGAGDHFALTAGGDAITLAQLRSQTIAPSLLR